jgi:hypothetical protein
VCDGSGLCLYQTAHYIPPCCTASLQAALGQYEVLYQQYASLAASLGQEPDLTLSLDPQQQLVETRTALAAAAAAGSGGRISLDGTAPGGVVVIAGRVPRGRASSGDMAHVLGSGGVVSARDGSEVPQLVSVGPCIEGQGGVGGGCGGVWGCGG